jgi:hypothetical protein
MFCTGQQKTFPWPGKVFCFGLAVGLLYFNLSPKWALCFFVPDLAITDRPDLFWALLCLAFVF